MKISACSFPPFLYLSSSSLITGRRAGGRSSTARRPGASAPVMQSPPPSGRALVAGGLPGTAARVPARARLVLPPPRAPPDAAHLQRGSFRPDEASARRGGLDRNKSLRVRASAWLSTRPTSSDDEVEREPGSLWTELYGVCVYHIVHS
ncbi:hypothetical protein EVAR_14063_1 [Eumeta japonica]|uniref:Uncharacterized protein n=1 Tax=Eumeta variegata TaxID=151549 RepID=A0A4C1UPV3_EUMVA|nr:hypothetical protein EVAR_14063_1 [Eumeta japonica]